MDFSRSSSSSSRSRANKKPDIYSTFVVHDDGSDNDENAGEEEEEEEDSSSLPPLLQRLPEGFGAAIDDDDDEEEDDDDGGGDYSGTFIVKKDNRPSPAPASRRTLRSRSPRGRSDLDDVYSTFVVKSTLRSRAAAAEEEEEEDSSVSGTFVRRSVGGFGSPFMSEAVESMRASEQQQQQQRQEHVRRKASVSSVPESLTREDPSTKYELLHELVF